MDIVPNANLTVQKATGILTIANENRANSSTDIHNVSLPSQNPLTFSTTKQDSILLL